MNASASEVTSNQTAGNHRSYWTRWFNVDSPHDDDGDYETVERITNIYGKICETGFQIFSAQCRNGGTGEIFDKDFVRGNNSNVLDRGCTSDGLVCRNSAQVQGRGQCQDYSVQFGCQYQKDVVNATNYSTQFDIRIYIILTVVPIFLLVARVWWVYVYRRRKMKRRRNQNINSDNEIVDDSLSITSDLRKPPPSYKELFAKNGNLASSVFAISRETVYVCSLCERAQCSVAVITRKNCKVISPYLSRETAGNVISPTLFRETAGEVNSRTLSRETVGEVICPTVSRETVDEVNSPTLSRETNLTDQESRNQETNSEGREESKARIIHETKETTVFIQLTQSHTPTNESPNSATIDICRTASLFDIASNYPSIAHDDRQQTEGPTSVNIEHELTRQICQTSQTTGQLSSSSLSTSSETQCVTSNLNCLLNPTWQQPTYISQPCPCPCHRTVTPKHQRQQRYDNTSNSADEIGDLESRMYPSCSHMHTTMFNHTRVWVESPRSSSVDQSELPTYEDALILTEIKAAESEHTSL